MLHGHLSHGCLDRLEGRIMMLPKREDIADSIPADPPIDNGIFNHPVIVLSKKESQGKVAVFVVKPPSSLYPVKSVP